MNPQSWKDEAAALSSHWLEPESSSVSNGEYDQQASEHVRALVADLLLIDALLNRCGEQPDAAHTSRIDRIMNTISDDTRTTSRPPSQHRNMVSWMAIVTCLVIASCLVWLRNARTTQAQDLLHELGVASQSAIDLVYQVVREEPNNNNHRKSLGKLYLRGTTGFVYVCNEATFGRRNDEYWAVLPAGPVLISRNFNWITADSHSDVRELELLKSVSTASSECPLMELSSLVALVERDYSVTIERHTTFSTSDRGRLIGTRRTPDDTLPETILLAFQTQSKFVDRVEMEWHQKHDRYARLRIIFEALPAEPVTEDWYQHDSHHSDEHEIVRIATDTTPEQ